jgi:DNA-binding YbaB/EbfC family protein
MFENLKGMSDMMKLMGQAGKIKESMAAAQERAKNRTIDGEAGAGMVKVTANGVGEVVSIHIDPEALKDPESIGPLLVSATNLALQRSKEVLMEETQTAMGGIDLPPGMLGQS